MTRFTTLRVVALSLAAASPFPLAAQTGAIVQPLTPNADRLSEQMRILGRSPNDLSALIEAGRLSAKLGDTDAAMQFLARAERVSASDPRIRAVRAAALVTMERPGEALALFDAAERAGLSLTDYAADRGMAYDLLGYTGNAQREYRIALRQGSDDEVTRRLALSLGIDGDVAGATTLLDPLLRQNDRAAWRVRAFVLAMSGDAAGADRIAASMLPGFGPSLAPFFRRLPQLSPADRAFAVHFGRLAPTPERLADARLAPSIVAVPRTTAPPVALAAATPSATRPSTAAERRAAAREAQRAQAGQRTRQATQARVDAAARQAAATRAAAAQQLAARDAEQARLAEAARVETARVEAVRAEAARVAAVQAEQLRVAARAAEERRLAAEQQAERDRVASAPVQVAALPAPVASIPATPAPVTATPTPAPTPAPVTTTSIPAASSAFRSVAERAGRDEVLARIVRNLNIPASELGVTAPVAPPDPATLAASASEARAAAQAAEAEAAAETARRAADVRKAAEARAAVAKRAAEAKRVADAKRAEDAARAAEAKRLAAAKRADPARHWVQVAGGPNIAGLPVAWRMMAAKAPELKTRQAWTTPLKATNRLLTGPFPTDDAAQAFVNKLRGNGVQAFTFTSEAGQKVARVPTS